MREFLPINVSSQAVAAIKKVLPKSYVEKLRPTYDRFNRILRHGEIEAARKAFEEAPRECQYLDRDALETLQARYTRRFEYGYDMASLERRGTRRAQLLLQMPGAREAERFLEIGCWDAMVSWGLRRQGKSAIAIDKQGKGLDRRAIQAGVEFTVMDAACLSFEDECFDFVFSFDTFEHVQAPEEVLREAARVVRKGGYLYLDFGPLYCSPYGEHAYRSISVPYCQFLFSPQMLNDFCRANALPTIDASHVNRWSLTDYRDLWQHYSGQLRPEAYREVQDLSHLNLIRRFPACFRSRVSDFESLVVSNIAVLFKKL